MSFMSVAFTGERSKPLTPQRTIDDLGIDSLFGSKRASQLMRTPASVDEILYRREIFGSFPSLFGDLYSCLLSLSELDSAFNSARGEFEKAYIFCALLREYITFVHTAIGCEGDGFFISRMRENFAKIASDSKFDNCNQELLALSEDTAAFSLFPVSISGETLAFRGKSGESVMKRLGDVFAKLGFEPYLFKPDRVKAIDGLISALEKEYPERAKKIKSFYGKYSPLYDPDILSYLDELEFYISINRFFDENEKNGIPSFFPEITSGRLTELYDLFDISLLPCENGIVPNDLIFDENRLFYILTGANGGGKTTYLRAVGINLLLFMSGAPVACRGGISCPLNAVYTHFPTRECFDSDGRLADEKARLDEIFASAGENSVILLNETYSSTNDELSAKLTAGLAKRLLKESKRGIFVTHSDIAGAETIPKLIADYDEENERNTYKILPGEAAASSRAGEILRKYGLCRELLQKRYFEK